MGAGPLNEQGATASGYSGSSSRSHRLGQGNEKLRQSNEGGNLGLQYP